MLNTLLVLALIGVLIYYRIWLNPYLKKIDRMDNLYDAFFKSAERGVIWMERERERLEKELLEIKKVFAIKRDEKASKAVKEAITRTIALIEELYTMKELQQRYIAMLEEDIGKLEAESPEDRELRKWVKELVRNRRLRLSDFTKEIKNEK